MYLVGRRRRLFCLRCTETRAEFVVRHGCGPIDEAERCGQARAMRYWKKDEAALWAESKTRDEWRVLAKPADNRLEPPLSSELICRAGMAELADAADSKSAEGNLVGVRPPPPGTKIIKDLYGKPPLRASDRFCLVAVL